MNVIDIIDKMNNMNIVDDKVDELDIWEHILTSIKYNDKNMNSIITSKDIKDANSTWKGKKNQFEPRLLCKQDTDEDRPKIFKKLGLYLFSIKNGEYLLTKNNIYVSLDNNIDANTDTDIVKIQINHTSSILSIGNSEISMLDNLRYNGIFERPELIGEKILHGPLLGGRHRCHFDTIFGGEKITINGSQYETDGCFESENYICIIEAKSKIVSNVNIRQLYYPYREVYNTIAGKKKIISLFIYKDKLQVIHIYKYIWNNPEIMMDIECVGHYRYTY